MSDILLLDFEATGKEPKTSRITEIGAQLCDEHFNVKTSMNMLVWESGYPAITPEVEEVTGITQEMLTREGVKPSEALKTLANFAGKCKYAIAYNKEYDETLFKAEALRNEVAEQTLWLRTSPWLCAMVDVEQNYKKKCWKLSHLALDYGLAVDPLELHRAINDVELMRRMLIRINTTPERMFMYQQTPWIYVAANVRKPWEDGGESTNLAKAQGYTWQVAKGDPEQRVFDKRWVKRIKEMNFDSELLHQFRVEKL